MVNPVPGYRITTPFRRTGRWWSLGWHTGADWAAPTGRAVVAAAPGRVVYRGTSRAFGLYVVVESVIDGKRVRGYYAHLSGAAVSVGHELRAGGRIGTVGATGNATGPHLHLEARLAPYAFNSMCIRNPSMLVNVGAAQTGGRKKGRAIPLTKQRKWTVTAKKLNGRAGPGTNYRVLVTRSRGHTLWGARETNNWIRSRTGRWFAKRYVRRS